jgi:hypothetical protein
MDLKTIFTNLKDTKLWLKWVVFWLISAILGGLAFSLTSGVSAGIYWALYFHPTITGLGILFYHPKGSLVPVLAALAVSLVLVGFLTITGFGRQISLLDFLTTWGDFFSYGLFLGMVFWFSLGCLWVAAVVLGHALNIYLKIENKIVGPRENE